MITDKNRYRLKLALGAAGLALAALWLPPLGELFPEPLSPVLFSSEGRLLGARPAADGQWRFPRGEAVPERFYRAYHPEYRPRPPFRPGCGGDPGAAGGRVMSLIYPEPGTEVFIPVDLDGNKSEVVFEAVHRQPETFIHWHLDEDYLGTTQSFHQVSLRPAPGDHLLVLVDSEGRRLERRFRVISGSGIGGR